MRERFRLSENLLIGIILTTVTLAVYWQVVRFEFVNFDDDHYVENNPAVQAGLNSVTIRWALTTNYQANWHPLTWMSLMLDSDIARMASWLLDLSLGKNNSGFYHLTNLLFHVANTLLLFIVLKLMTGRHWPSAFVSALFAVHPLHVESVAWISERKDVLSTLFWLLTMYAYWLYTRSPGRKSYAWVIVAFVLGLMSKPMLVSLPIVLLLLDVWPLGRLRSNGMNLRVLLIEKWPMFVLTAISCVLTIWAQRSGGAMGEFKDYPFGVRLANAAVSYVAYLGKMIWPANLSVLYLHPGTKLPMWQVVLSAIELIVATFLAVRTVRTRPYVTVGWLWYLITLIPVIGLVQVGMQAMADRYTYVPLIGIFIIIAWGVPDLLGVERGRASRSRLIALGAAGCAVTVALAAAAYQVVGTWQNSIALFTQALRVDPANSLAYNNIGNALLERGDVEKAVKYFRLAIKFHPEYIDVHYNLGNALYTQGKIKEAIAQYKYVIKRCPDHVSARNNLGSVYANQGLYDLAIAQYKSVLKIDPENQRAKRNLNNALKAKAGEI
ncbi:MAG: tetratricopeptide repeat protein [Armatimonadetes bacterium]|nr:tetratricopeptide repeat protein [Armatimonadota bacterium]